MGDSAKVGSTAVARVVAKVSEGVLEVFVGSGGDGDGPTLVAAHPAEGFSEGAVLLLQDASGARAICINPRGLGASSLLGSQAPYTLQAMVDDIEAARKALGYAPWVFWGMSGGGWLGQIYAHRHPDALAGLILESICPCFRLRLADPACLLSPFYPAWREELAQLGLLDVAAHADGQGERATEWLEVDGVGSVFRRHDGPALLVSPTKVSQDMQRAMPVLFAVDTRAWLSSIRVPTLVLCGTADPIVPIAHARALHAAIPGSRFVAIEGAGHVPTTERRPEVASAVRGFLADHYSR
jgi:pimeloyl-ACP methyl ester carboxylesterase